MRHFIICCLSVFCMSLTVAYAATAPSSILICHPIKPASHQDSLILEGDAKTGKLYLIHNMSQKSIWLDQASKHVSASAGWSSYLRPGNWAALVLNRKDFPLTCSVIQPGQVATLNCATALSVCEPQHVSLQSIHKGSYWVVEDKSWDVVVKALEKKGISQKSLVK